MLREQAPMVRNSTGVRLKTAESRISARSRRIQLLMLFGFVLHCRDFGLAYLIGTLRPITGPFCWTQNLLSLAFHNTLLAFQKLYNRSSFWL